MDTRIKRIVGELSQVDGMELWDVLTALRGPDNETPGLKSATTEVIRHKIGMKDLVCGAYASADSETKARFRRSITSRNHFTLHAANAFEALGLKWDECNKD